MRQVPSINLLQKGHTADFKPATLSSWLKQTIPICYKQMDQQAIELVQVKAHNIRAFADSKALNGGFSMDQILQHVTGKHTTHSQTLISKIWHC